MKQGECPQWGNHRTTTVSACQSAKQDPPKVSPKVMSNMCAEAPENDTSE